MKTICLAVIGFGLAYAQGLQQAPSQQKAVPLFRVGVAIGRDGSAFGPGVIIEGNPIERFGVYAFAGTSRVNGYDAGDGIKANFHDRTFGFGLEVRVYRFGRMTLGGFGQAAYYGSHVHASYPDGEGGFADYFESDRDPLVTIGPQLEFSGPGGIDFFVRPGKDFGSNFAAETVGGFSLNGGILFDPLQAFQKLRKAL